MERVHKISSGSSVVQFLAIVKGNTPFPKWYALFIGFKKYVKQEDLY